MKPSRACTASLSARVKRRLTMDLTFTSSWSWQVIRSNTKSQRQIAGRKPNAANRPEFSLSLLSSRATCLSGCPLRPCPWFLYLFYLQLMERKRLMFTYWWGVFVAVSSTCHLIESSDPRRCDAPPSLSHSGLNSERPLVFDLLQMQRSLLPPLPLPHAHKPTIIFLSFSLVFEWLRVGWFVRTLLGFCLLVTPFRCGGRRTRTKRATRSKSLQCCSVRGDTRKRWRGR